MSGQHSPDDHRRFRVVVIGPNLFGADADFHVHAADCADLRRNQLYRDHTDEIDRPDDIASLRELVHTIYDPHDFDYRPENWADFATGIEVFPCLDLPDEH
ncbi:hypothetical protein OG225_43185 (plasmid) [Nocardia sp. NBC_01377]|uniref:hypothetical protein n=1 Tax=Nocardia sp. NBC_01377 TaxID=2903595 RepID=UPI002F909214